MSNHVIKLGNIYISDTNDHIFIPIKMYDDYMETVDVIIETWGEISSYIDIDYRIDTCMSILNKKEFTLMETLPDTIKLM